MVNRPEDFLFKKSEAKAEQKQAKKEGKTTRIVPSKISIGEFKVVEVKGKTSSKKLKPTKRKGVKFKLPKFKKVFKKERGLKFKGASRKELATRLLSRRELTAQKILDSPGASPVAKTAARRILE